MKLIQLVIALFARHYLEHWEQLRQPEKVMPYLEWMRARLAEWRVHAGVVQVALLLLPVAVVLGVLQIVLEHFLFGLGGMVFGVLALIYCFGTRQLEDVVEPFLEAWERGDHEAAGYHAIQFENYETARDARELPAMVTRSLLVQANERVFGVIFYFMLLGPAGALVFRFVGIVRDYVCRSPESEDATVDAIRRLSFILNWVPARLGAISYGIAGSLMDAFDYWAGATGVWPDSNYRTLASAGIGALRLDDEPDGELKDCGIEDVRAAHELITRSTIVWVGILALMTIAGWIH